MACNNRLPQFSDSFFRQPDPETETDISFVSDSSKYSSSSLFEELCEIRKLHPPKLFADQLNANSLRYKLDELTPLLTEKAVDILFISETKLDTSFRDQLFQVEGYRLERRD